MTSDLCFIIITDISMLFICSDHLNILVSATINSSIPTMKASSFICLTSVETTTVQDRSNFKTTKQPCSDLPTMATNTDLDKSVNSATDFLLELDFVWLFNFVAFFANFILKGSARNC